MGDNLVIVTSSPMKDPRAEMPFPSFPSEIFGMFIEGLGEDQHSLRACSLVSSVFRHLCSPILYRDIALDREEKVVTFIQFGERSDILRHVKSLSLTNPRNLHGILDTVSGKAPLETLCLHRVMFHAELLTAPLLSRLSTVTALVLRGCRFRGFEDFLSFIGCFPLCEVLRLRGCTWAHRWREDAKSKIRSLPAYNISPVHLEITNNFTRERGGEYCDQGKIFGAAWLGLAGLKSFTYTIGSEVESESVLERIAASKLLEEIDISLSLSPPPRRNFVIAVLTPFVARIKSLTIRCDYGFTPLWTQSGNVYYFPPSQTLEWMRIITLWSVPVTEGYVAMDATFSDTDRYPSLKGFEVCSDRVATEGKRGRDIHERWNVDKCLPRLKALGRLLPAYDGFDVFEESVDVY